MTRRDSIFEKIVFVVLSPERDNPLFKPGKNQRLLGNEQSPAQQWPTEGLSNSQHKPGICKYGYHHKEWPKKRFYLGKSPKLVNPPTHPIDF